MLPHPSLTSHRLRYCLAAGSVPVAALFWIRPSVGIKKQQKKSVQSVCWKTSYQILYQQRAIENRKAPNLGGFSTFITAQIAASWVGWMTLQAQRFGGDVWLSAEEMTAECSLCWWWLWANCWCNPGRLNKKCSVSFINTVSSWCHSLVKPVMAGNLWLDRKTKRLVTKRKGIYSQFLVWRFWKLWINLFFSFFFYQSLLPTGKGQVWTNILLTIFLCCNLGQKRSWSNDYWNNHQ